MPQTMPHKVATVARRALVASVPLTAGIVVGQAVLLWESRPYLTLMVFCVSLGVSMVAGVVWALAVCHLTVVQAFSAGVTVGQATQPVHPKPGRPVNLRAVD